MTQGDVNAHFEKISDKAKTATDHLKAAGQKTRDQLESEIKTARDKATAKADQLEDKTDAAHDKASSQWQEVRDKWHAHVAEGEDGRQEEERPNRRS